MHPLDKKTEQEVLEVYHAFFDAFFSGSVEKIKPLIHENIQVIGSTEAEILRGKDTVLHVLWEVLQQTQGALEPRNRNIRVMGVGNTALVEEFNDTFVKLDGQWFFYAKTRSTFLLEQGPAGWQIVYQHASIPDSSAVGEETLGLERIQKENTELREAVRRRTRELELKNRELEVEAALERVRARALAMQRSSEIKEVAATMRNELLGLGIEGVSAATIWLEQPNGRIRAWDFTIVENTSLDKDVQVDVEFDPKDAPPRAHFHKIWNRRGNYWVGESDLDDLYESVNWLKTQDEKAAEDMIRLLDSGELKYWWHPTTVLEKGRLNVDLVVPPPEEMATILPKMAAAFDLAYRRFEDLQKAEAQAQETRIEAALEKVRSRTMGMRHSDELPEAASLLFREVQALGIPTWSCGYNILSADKKSCTSIMSAEGGLRKPLEVPLTEHESFLPWCTAIQNNDEFLVYRMEGEDLEEHYSYMKSLPGFKEFERSGIELPACQINHLVRFSQGFLLFIASEEMPEAHDIFKRFGVVFNQTYTRFLDLRKAEVQAQEAQIEAALERVRSRAIAMRHSDELSEAAELLYQEFFKLGVESFSCGYLINDDENAEWKLWLTNPGEPFFKEFWTAPFEADHNLKARYESWQRREPFHCAVLEGEENRAHHMVISQYAPWKADILDSLPPRLVFNSAHFSLGHLLVISPDRLAPELEQAMVRFARVFDLTYRRFLDLQKAEARAREERIEAGLDRFRAEIASMRSTEDLERITPLIWRELTKLEVPFFRCGLFIMDEKNELVHTYLSTPDGKPLSVVQLSFDSAVTIRKTVSHWRKQEVYSDYWDQQQFINWVQSLTKLGYIKEGQAYQGTEHPPEALALHFVPFKQGMLYIGNSEKLSEDQIDLVQRLADTFAVAYARYEDFIKLEEAKNRVESTLTELKATQTQLIQQEKLASLGQLTAGIAHEIKNPLNFVNNFSEVSIELLEELAELGQSANDPEVQKEFTDLISDIKSNLQKIHQHGARADGIVKSMLLHSRGGSGVPEPTDLNAFIKEYVNLAFHGMRAGKEPINVSVELNLDEKTGKIPLVSEDFSRVILNLCHNAFDAMRDKLAQEKENSYQPCLTISTRQNGKEVSVEVADNGPGIPEAIRDKVLQPFFTTKKGTQGTGLGLSITNDIVKAHRGTLTIETASGTGTVFKIKIPNE